jgi:hypothetical protein
MPPSAVPDETARPGSPTCPGAGAVRGQRASGRAGRSDAQAAELTAAFRNGAAEDFLGKRYDINPKGVQQLLPDRGRIRQKAIDRYQREAGR